MIEKANVLIGEMFYGVREDGVEIGIKICDFTMYNQGYGKIVLSILITYLFSLGHKKIILDTNVENRIAQHVYECLGFEKAGIRKNAWKDQNGKWQSSVDYVLCANQFHSFLKNDLM